MYSHRNIFGTCWLNFLSKKSLFNSETIFLKTKTDNSRKRQLKQLALVVCDLESNENGHFRTKNACHVIAIPNICIFYNSLLRLLSGLMLCPNLVQNKTKFYRN